MHSGDVGIVLPNGAVKIIDRAKNIFKLSQGEYIAPEKLENIYGKSPWIAQSFMYGDSLRDCIVGIIVVDPETLEKYAKDNGKVNDAKILDDSLKKIILTNINDLAKSHELTSLEKPKDIILKIEPFTVENNTLTPTFKLKRNICRDIFAGEIA